MKNSVRLFRVVGIDIGIHYTWIFIFILISWSLAQGFFPQVYPGWARSTYWTVGVVAALSLFVSVLLHELAHSLVARSRGMAVSSITLFIFGGVSNLEEEPRRPKIEFMISVVGPLTSLVLGLAFLGLSQTVADRLSPLAALMSYLGTVNIILAAFNILPGFPLDGGRVLRSIIWASTGSLTKATNVAATVGRIFGWALIVFGVFQLLSGNFLGGLWIAFIGWFLGGAAEASQREVTVQQRLSGVRVRDVMSGAQEAIGSGTTVADVVSGIFRRQHGRAVPVCDDGRLVGIVTLTDVRELPQAKWGSTAVGDIMTRGPLLTVKPDDDLGTAMRLIAQHDVNQVLVLRNDQCAGILSRADVIRYLQLRQELGLR